MTGPHKKLALSVGALGVSLAAATWVLCVPGVPREWQVLACGITVLPWLAAIRWRMELSTSDSALPWILAIGLILRILVLPSPPVFSGDLHRYIWDGTVSLSGTHPMRHAPDSDELAHLRASVAGWEDINHPELATIYPPVAQGLFAAGVLLGGAMGVKFLIALADMALCLALASLLRSRGRSVTDVAIYAWCPFPILEFAGTGHLDPLMWAPAFGALALLACRATRHDSQQGGSRDRILTSSAGALLGVAVLAKLFAIVALPFLLRRRRDWPAAAACMIVVVCGMASFSLPLDQAGDVQTANGAPATYLDRSPAHGFYETLIRYSDKWRWNDSLFAISEGVVLTVTGIDPLVTGPTHVERLAKAALLVPVALLALWVFARPRPPEAASRVETGMLLMIAAYLWTSPVVHPWYLAWALPGAVLRRSPAWFYLAAASWLTYLPDPAGGANVPLWIRLVEYVPAALLLAWCMRQGHPSKPESR